MRRYRELATAIRLAGVIGLVAVMAGCSQSSRSPTSPSLSPAPPPVIPIPSNPAPVVTDVIPSVGSAAGGASIKIVGTGFMPGMIAIFDGIKVTPSSASFAAFYTETPAHAAGMVDLVVTNPDGQSHRVEGGYTYAPADSFDPNGGWGGYSLNGTDTWVEFVIRGNRIVSASCTCPTCTFDAKTPLTFAEFPSVRDGEFSVATDNGARMSGRILSASEMAGTISVPSCTTTPLMWRANRSTDSSSLVSEIR